MPEAGIALTFPDDWVVEVHPIVRSEFISDAVLSAEAPGSDSCDVSFQEGAAWNSLDDWAALKVPVLREYGAVTTSTALHLPMGDAIRIDADVAVEGFFSTTYLLTDGAIFYTLICTASDPPDDRWLAIAETFEFLHVAE